MSSKNNKEKNWSDQDDQVLIDTVYNNAKEGNTLTKAIEAAAKELNKTVNSVTYRWNNHLRKTVNFDPKELKRESKRTQKQAETVEQEEINVETKPSGEENTSEVEVKSENFITSKEIAAYIEGLEQQNQVLQKKYIQLKETHDTIIKALNQFES